MKTMLLKGTLALSVALGVFFPMAAQADVTQWVDVSQQQGKTLPMVSVTDDQQVLFQVNNDTPQPMKFMVPTMGVNENLLPHSEQTFHVDMSKTSHKQVPYQLSDASGGMMSQGTIDNAWRFHSDINLASIINYSTSYNAESKPEPHYYDPSHGKVRGFW